MQGEYRITPSLLHILSLLHLFSLSLSYTYNVGPIRRRICILLYCNSSHLSISRVSFHQQFATSLPPSHPPSLLHLSICVKQRTAAQYSPAPPPFFLHHSINALQLPSAGQEAHVCAICVYVCIHLLWVFSPLIMGQTLVCGHKYLSRREN